MRATVKGPRAQEIAGWQEDELARIQTAAVRENASLFLEDVREETWRGLGGRSRLPKAWRMRMYPEVGVSLDPAGWVYVRGPRPGVTSYGTPASVLIDAFERGVAIMARRGGWLAIPTDAAGKRAPLPGNASRGRGSQMARITPEGFERRSGMTLRFVPVDANKALLVVDGASRERPSKRGGGRAIPYRAKGRYSKQYGPAGVTLVVFTLLRQVRLPKRLDFVTHERAAELRWEQLLSKHWR